MSMCDSPEQATQASLPKDIFGYEIIDVLGEGAGAVLYVACDPASGQLYALKHAVRRKEKDIRFIDQMKTEYEVGVRIKHKALRKSIDLKIAKSILGKPTEAVMLLELFDGKPLDKATDIPLYRMVEFFSQVAGALWSLHERGFVHCDLKPNNILVNHDGEVKVIDLGQACRVGTVKDRIQGTPDFIAPEQVRCEKLTERTDAFNFGATFYWALTGRTLPTMLNIGDKEGSFIINRNIPTPIELNPMVPDHLSKLVMDCVKANPEQRPGDMGDLSTRLDTIAYSIRRRTEQMRLREVA